jgi:hypothetical protein
MQHLARTIRANLVIRFLLIFGLCISLLLQLFLAESYPPYLLQQRARAKRIETGQWAYHAELDGVVVTPKDIVWRYILRPTAMLVLEPSESDRHPRCTTVGVRNVIRADGYTQCCW